MQIDTRLPILVVFAYQLDQTRFGAPFHGAVIEPKAVDCSKRFYYQLDV
jgi:hypothetical protein